MKAQPQAPFDTTRPPLARRRECFRKLSAKQAVLHCYLVSLSFERGSREMGCLTYLLRGAVTPSTPNFIKCASATGRGVVEQ
jgi:hypothetical protein